MPSRIIFTKMHGLGNDFVVINNIDQKIDFSAEMISTISNRHFGIGCDQVLILEKATEANIDFNYRIFNSDGSEVGQCGNGARCLAKFIHDKKLSDKKQLNVKTITSILELTLQKDGDVSVRMGIPKDFRPIQTLAFSGLQLSLGNPHAVFKVDNIKDSGLSNLGLDSINIGFMKVIDRTHIKLRVFERGAGETQACGSGACAAVVVGIKQNELDNTVCVELTGGKLYVSWAGEGQPVIMTGPAVTVFEGILP
ncbi:MAG TPA: diaminopimelate epimerase [Gammaproteobacteria bacterium]|nr:diaminopimelate epimerase [Gammaproteobacteria bacterium]